MVFSPHVICSINTVAREMATPLGTRIHFMDFNEQLTTTLNYIQQQRTVTCAIMPCVGPVQSAA